METIRVILKIAEGVSCIGCFALAASLLLKNRKTKIPCETCGNLRVKNRRTRKTYRYLCGMKLLGFNNPPLYCDKYRKREEVIIPEKRVCDFCGAENPEHQATYLPVNTSCEWTEGRSTEPRIEMKQYDICEKCLLSATNIYADFQGCDPRIASSGRIIRRGEKNNG